MAIAFQYTYGSINLTYSHPCEVALVVRARINQPLTSVVGLRFLVRAPG